MFLNTDLLKSTTLCSSNYHSGEIMLLYFSALGFHAAEGSSYAFLEVDNKLFFRAARDSDADVLKQVNGH